MFTNFKTMSSTLVTNFEIIRNAVKDTAGVKTTDFKFDPHNRIMWLRTPDVSAKADIQANINKLSVSLGFEYTENHTTGKLKFEIKL